MKKKTGLLILLLTSFLIMTGFGNKEVVLFHSGPVIDLAKAIKLARPGGDEGEQNDTTARDNSKSGNLDSTYEPEQQLPNDIKIIVSGKNISVDGKVINDVDEIEEIVRQAFRVDVTYELIDNYAEYHVYKDVMSVLEKLKAEIGLHYTME